MIPIKIQNTIFSFLVEKNSETINIENDDTCFSFFKKIVIKSRTTLKRYFSITERRLTEQEIKSKRFENLDCYLEHQFEC